MIKIYLTRHGQTEENLAHIFQGRLPGTLTAAGKEQARALKQRIKGIHFDAIVSSDLQRVIDTVNIAFPNRTIPWETTPLLREIDWGSWTGKKISSVDTNCPPPDTETREMLYVRAGDALQYLREHYDGQSILIVAHGIINRHLQCHLMELPLERFSEVTLMDNCEVREYTL